MKRNVLRFLTVVAGLLIGFGITQRSHADDSYVVFSTGEGIQQSKGLNTQAVSLDIRNWRFTAERFGGEATTTMSYAAAYVYEPGWRPFNLQPLLMGGVAYFEDEVFMPHRPNRALISDQWTYRLGVGVRFHKYVELWLDVHDSTRGFSEINTGVDRPMLTVRAPTPW